jgi:hypothetical protein
MIAALSAPQIMVPRPAHACTWSLSQEYDILGLGQLMIDYAAAVDDKWLETLDVPKGGRR